MRAFAVTLAALLAVGPALAGTFEDAARLCGDAEAPPGDRVVACGILLDSGDLADDSYATVYLMRGRAHADAGSPEAAIGDFSEVIERYPDFTVAYGLRALAYQQLGHGDLALEDLLLAYPRARDREARASIVSSIQLVLRGLGFPSGPTSADGQMTPEIREAIEVWKRSR